MPEIITFQDLEEYWKDLRPHRVEVSVDRSPLQRELEAVRQDLLKEAVDHLKNVYNGQSLNDPNTVVAIVLDLTVLFMDRWYKHMKHYDVAYLVEVILESQKDLPLSDVKGFIRALPMTILSRILNESRGQMTGLHALVACEVRRREGELNDYDIRADDTGKLIVSFRPPPDPRATRTTLSFSLRDIFGGP